MMFVHQNLLCIQYVNEQMPKVGMYRKVIRKKKMKKKISGLIFLKSPLDLTVNDDDYFFSGIILRLCVLYSLKY